MPCTAPHTSSVPTSTSSRRSAWKRLPARWFRLRASPTRRSLPAERAHRRGRPGSVRTTCGRVHPGQQHLHHTATRRTRKRNRLATGRTARRARDRLFTHRHDRMVTVGLDDGGSEMTTGVPTLLMIHGFLDDATVWDGVIGSLAGELVAVRDDLPGFGARSAAVAHACSATLESLAAEAGDFIAGIDGPVIVVGQSLGPQVAELVAAQPA